MSEENDINSSKEHTLFESSYNFAVDLIENKLDSTEGFYWLKKDIEYKSHSDICFVYKNTLFGVLIDVLDKNGKSTLEKRTIDKQLSASKKYNFIACRFPLLQESTDLKPKNKDLNLYNTKTNSLIAMEKYRDSKKKVMSDWAILCNGINYLKNYLISKKNQIVSIQDLSSEEPHIWYIDKKGNKCYAIAQIENLNDDSLAKEDEADIVDRYKQFNGYEALLSVSANTKKFYYDSKHSVDLKFFVRINKAEEKVLYLELIEKENIHELILKTFRRDNLSNKKGFNVYVIPEFEDYILKIKSAIFSNFALVSSDLVLVPYMYEDENLKNNPNIGIPLYRVANRNSQMAKLGYVIGDDENLNKSGIKIIKRVYGTPVNAMYNLSLALLFGATPSKFIASDFNKILDINELYGSFAAFTVLKKFENKIYHIEQGCFSPYSKAYDFFAGDMLIDAYDMFESNYVETQENISKLPQKTFDNAVSMIMSVKDCVFDFANIENILYDKDEKEFRFINPHFDKNLVNEINKDKQIEKFKKALFGESEYIYYNPKDLIFDPSRINSVNTYHNIINEKIDLALRNVCT